MPDGVVSAQPSSPPRIIWLLPLLSAAYAVLAGRDANWSTAPFTVAAASTG